MPGIVGIISQRPSVECTALVEKMIGSMLHESFYVSGRCHDTRLGTYSGWVAHEGSFATTESRNDEKDVSVSFSGECYFDSYKSVADQYREQGEAFIPQLNGLFAGLIIDRARGAAFLFNDRYGFDRIYISEVGDELFFASEAKALLAVLPQARAFDSDGLADFLAFGCAAGTRTLFRGIYLLPAGSIWIFRDGRCRKQRYFTPAEWESEPVVNEREFQTEFDRTVENVLPKYFADSQDLGLSLTAGIDSRLVMAEFPPACSPICYTYEGESGETRDGHLARRIAQAAGCDHRLLRLGGDFFLDFAEYFERTVFLTDGTFGATGPHELYLSRAARAFAPIRLTGVFGGEILRHVSTFDFLELDRRLLGDGVTVRKELPTMNDHPVTAAAFKEIPWSIFGSLAACRSQLTFRTPYLDNDIVRLAYRIPPTLRGSSRPMIEFIRKRDPRLASIHTDMGLLGNGSKLSTLLRRAVAKATFKLDYWCNDGMPHWLSPFEGVLAGMDVLGRHKYLRYRRWFRQELADYLRDSLRSASIRESGLWNKKFVDQLAQTHISGRKNLLQEIDAVLTLDAVQRLLLVTTR